ncbi:MAG: CHAD domain-containing protein [Propionibacteriaceae bacterium]
MPTARAVIEPYVTAQSATIRASMDSVRSDSPDAIHATRVATRRLRSALATYAPLWEHGHGPLRRELRWYASELSRARDLEVVGEWLARLCADPSVVAVGDAAAAAAEVSRRVDTDRRDALALIRRDLDGARFAELGAQLPPQDWSALAEVPAQLVLTGLAAATALAVADEAATLPDDGSRPVALHELRKSAKAARYAMDALGPKASAHSAIWKQVTESLGLAQDAWVARMVLDELQADEPEHDAVWRAILELVDGAAAEAEATGLDLVRTATSLPHPEVA